MDELLPGGLGNPGQVFRRGDVVDRPAQSRAPAIHRFLHALRAHGFDGVPVPVGLKDGREQLTFVVGDVAMRPYPDWSLTEQSLASVGALLRRLHEASSAIPVDRSVTWAVDLADPRGGTMLCHNDACMENVVFRDGEAFGLIDFDLAAPGRPLWDVAMAARFWVPMLDPGAAAYLPAYVGLDPFRRLRILADGYEMSAADRAEFPGAIEEATVVDRAEFAARLEAGDAPFIKAFNEHGGWETWDRLQAWLVDQRSAFLEALLA